MMRNLPTSDQILEDLADKAAAHIERRAPVAFDDAWREMTRYHRFLLALNASQDGTLSNYAEIVGDSWTAPHHEWLRQYRRLFERAADRIPDDDHFIRTLAYTPSNLLPRSGEPRLPPTIITGILSLGPMMMHRLEAWVTKRTTLETPKGQSAEPRLALAGSDAKAYKNVLPELVGAWESLLYSTHSLYWRREATQSDAERWSAFGASWPVLWQHLKNTAHCLAVATWNEDEAGTALFREALVRWPQTLGHRFDHSADLRRRRYLLPDILMMNWSEATARAMSFAYDYMPAPSPDQLFASVIRGVHDDVLLLTAGLLLFWTIDDKQASDLGGRTAKALLHREGSEENDPNQNLSSLFLDLLRFEITGDRYRDGSYAAHLDSLVEVLDNMTERRVVPGRVFTPSTLHGRDGLLVSMIAILAAATPDQGDGGFTPRIAELANEEGLIPGGDRSLRGIVHELARVRSTLDHAPPQLARGIAVLAPERDIAQATSRLREIVSAAEETIESQRRQRLKDRAIDAAKLEDIRSAVQAALLEKPGVPYFQDVDVEKAGRNDTAEWREVLFEGIDKAQLVEPPMESPAVGLKEMLVSHSLEAAGRHAWLTFTRRPRVQVDVDAKVEQEAFWKAIAGPIKEVGSAPVLIVSQLAEGRALRSIGRTEHLGVLQTERRPYDRRGGSYLVTVESVDVVGADLPAGVAWLFSADALHSMRYAQLDTPDRYVDATFEPGEDMKGILRIRFRQQVEWTDAPIFEIRTPKADKAEDLREL